MFYVCFIPTSFVKTNSFPVTFYCFHNETVRRLFQKGQCSGAFAAAIVIFYQNVGWFGETTPKKVFSNISSFSLRLIHFNMVWRDD